MSGDVDTQAALRQMAEKIGDLTGTVRGLVDTWTRQEESASQGRRDLHAKVDAVNTKVTEVGATLAGVIKDVAEMKPDVTKFREMRTEARGAGKLGKAMWGLAVFLSCGFGWILSNWLTINLGIKKTGVG